MAKKIDRHELKEDKLATDIARIYKYATDNPTKVLIWAIVIAVVVASVIGFFQYKKAMNRRVQQKFSTVLILMDAERFQEAMDSVRVLVAEYANTKQGKLAKYLLGHLYYAFGKHDSAMVVFNEYISSEDADSDFAAAAMMGIAACLEDRRQYENAIEIYNTLMKKYPNYYRIDEAFISLARCYDYKGDIETARKLYREVLEKFPSSPLKTRAILSLARIEAVLPPSE